MKIKDRKKFITTIAIITLSILIIIGFIVMIVRDRINKTIEAEGQAIEENILEAQVEENQIEENEETEPLDENVIDENAIKESKVKDEKEIKDNKNKYYVKVNNQANVVTIYTKDSEGNYTVPVKAMVCSIGTATPTGGKYKLNGTRYTWHTLFGHTPGTYVYGQYSTAIVGNILFHSVPYTIKGNPSTLEYAEYDKLGTKASAGCIRLTVQDAAWIYHNISTGTIVEFYYDSNPGPLGKPSAKKISWNTECRGWDPTDSNLSNPWKNSNSSKQEPVDQPINNNAQQKQQQEQNRKEDNKKEQNKQEDNNQNQNKKDDGKQDKPKNNIADNKTDNGINNKIDNKIDNKIQNKTTQINSTNAVANKEIGQKEN